MESVQEWAIRYAKRGWFVIPLNGINEDGTCTCARGEECDSAGKHPFWMGWQDRASNDPKEVELWFDDVTPRNIGVVCGPSGLVVIDIDGPEGEALLRPLVEAGVVPACPQVRTRRGRHLYLRGTLPAAKLHGLDIKSGNGFVVAPPSMRADGEQYEWVA